MDPTALPKDWMIRPVIDRELLEYRVLGYLQRVYRRYKEQKLYPHLEALQEHAEDLRRYLRDKHHLMEQAQGPVIGFDPKTLAPIREKPGQPDPLNVVDDLVELALPNIERAQEEGIAQRREYASRIQFGSVGLMPLRPTEGWLLLRTGREVRTYAYAMPLFRENRPELQYRSVVTRFHGTWTLSLGCPYERIRAALIEQHPEQPVPATFVVETDPPLPYIETLLPLAKQMVYARLAAA